DTVQRAQIRKEHARKVLEEQKIQKARRLWQKHSEYLCTMKFRNTLPDPPLGPRFLKIPFALDKLSEFAPTTLDTDYKWQLHCERDVGVDIDVIDPGSYLPPPEPVPVPAEDLRLLTWQDRPSGASVAASSAEDNSRTARRRRVDTEVSWLKKPSYVAQDPYAVGHQKIAEKAAEERKAESQQQADRLRAADRRLEALQSFVAANGKGKAPQHPERPGAKVLWSVPVLPDLGLWGNTYTQVIFDEAPADDKAISGTTERKRKRVERALFRDMRKKTKDHGGDVYQVSYLVPGDSAGSDSEGGGGGGGGGDGGGGGGEGEYDWVKPYHTTVMSYPKVYEQKKGGEAAGNHTLPHMLLVVDAERQRATFCRLQARIEARNLAAHERPLKPGRGAIVSRRRRTTGEARDVQRRLVDDLDLREEDAEAVAPPGEPDDGGYSSGGGDGGGSSQAGGGSGGGGSSNGANSGSIEYGVDGGASGGGGGGGGSGGGGGRFPHRREHALDADQESVLTEPLESEGSNIAVKGTESSENGDELSRADSDDDL
ncbi:unnamed protein product, partial [Phaeothamnion confervicola]